jgi:hypothetical protein
VAAPRKRYEKTSNIYFSCGIVIQYSSAMCLAVQRGPIAQRGYFLAVMWIPWMLFEMQLTRMSRQPGDGIPNENILPN